MRKKQILAVDDDVEFMGFFQLALEMSGNYEVRCVYSATRALDVARELKPDLIILDCMMPGLNGSEVAARLQADPVLKSIPFLFLTATISEPELRPGDDGKLQTYLPKPFRLPQLIQCIEEKTSHVAPPRP